MNLRFGKNEITVDVIGHWRDGIEEWLLSIGRSYDEAGPCKGQQHHQRREGEHGRYSAERSIDVAIHRCLVRLHGAEGVDVIPVGKDYWKMASN